LRHSAAVVSFRQKYGFTFRQSQAQESDIDVVFETKPLFCNSILETVPLVVDEANAEALIFDAKNCKANIDNTILKTNRNKAEQKADVLDMFRYYLYAFFPNFIRMIES